MTSVAIPESRGLHIALWVVQALLAAAFLAAGGFKLATPADELIAQGMTVPTLLLRIAGASEILGALGLILPSALRIQPKLTAVAASLLAAVVGLAAIVHVASGQFASVAPPAVLGLLCVFVAWGRFTAAPISEK